LIVVQCSLLCHSHCLDDCAKKKLIFCLKKLVFVYLVWSYGFWCYSLLCHVCDIWCCNIWYWNLL